MATKFEDNLELEKLLDHIQDKIARARVIAEKSRPLSISAKLVRKVDFLDLSLDTLRAIMKIKESML